MQNHEQNRFLKPTRLAWVVFFLSASFLFYKYILQLSPAVMTGELMSAYSLTGAGLGFLVGFYFYTFLLMQIPSGMLLDKFGTRKLMTGAILICALGILIFSQTHSFVVACFARLLIGFGASFATVGYMKLASIWFPPQYFAVMSGLFGAACMLGAGVTTAPLSWLVNYVGWRNTLLGCAFLGVALCAIFWFLVPEKQVKQRNEDKKAPHSTLKGLLDVLRNKSNWPLMLYNGLTFTSAAVFGGLWGVPFLMQAYGLPGTAAATSVSLVFFGVAVGSLILSWLGKYIERYRSIIIIGTIMELFFLSVIIYVPNLPLWLLNTCIFFFGMSTSGFVLSYAIAKNTNALSATATAIAVINMGDPISGAMAEPLIGKLLDLSWDGRMLDGVRVFSADAFRTGLSVLIVYLLIALVCCFLIRETVSDGKASRAPIRKRKRREKIVAATSLPQVAG